MKVTASDAGMRCSRVNFKQAQVNILATADNHGNVLRLPEVIKTIEVNKKEIFPQVGKDSTQNIFAIAGDWFINPSKKGSKTKPGMTNGDIQYSFLLKTIETVKNICGDGRKFDTDYVPGNHCYDGGDKFIMKVIDKAPMRSYVTNVDLENSPALKSLMKRNKNVVTSHIYEIPDDKNPNLVNKLMMLGVTIPSMDFYNPGLLKSVNYLDNCNKKDANLKIEDIQGTINSVKAEVEKFKEENPKGAVILMSHTGIPISEMIRSQVPQINQILNGHDHKNGFLQKGKTNINSLGQDNEIIKALNLHFDDDGDLDSTAMNVYYTQNAIFDEEEKSDIQKYIENNFERDIIPLVELSDKTGEVPELSYGNEIRFSNSYLANYLTSAVKRAVRNTCPDVDAVTIQSSIIRGGIKQGSTNLDLMKVFDGVSEDLSNLRIGNVSGEEMSGLITENVLSNLKAPTRNTIIHWSDVQVNRTLISEISDGKSDKSYIDAVKFRNPKTKQFEPIDPEKQYKIVMGEKYLVKDDIEWPKKIRDRFVSLNKTYDQFFREYLESEEVDFNVNVTPKVKEQRIL